MGDLVVHEALVVALQCRVVGALQRLGERLERLVHLAAVDENPAPRRGEEDVLVVPEPPHALAVDLLHLRDVRAEHLLARELHRDSSRVKEHRLRHQLVDALEVLDHPVELELRGRHLALDHRHPQAVPAEVLGLGERLLDENARVVGDLLLGGLY